MIIEKSDYICETLNEMIKKDTINSEDVLKHIKECEKCGKSLSELVGKFVSKTGMPNFIAINNLLNKK